MILLADDDRALRKPTATFLRGLGWTVREVADGAAAVAAVDEALPRLLLFDVQMPGMDGLQALDRISAKHPDLPCILITGHPSMTGIEQHVDGERVLLLPKPFSFAALTELVEHLVGTPA